MHSHHGQCLYMQLHIKPYTTVLSLKGTFPSQVLPWSPVNKLFMSLDKCGGPRFSPTFVNRHNQKSDLETCMYRPLLIFSVMVAMAEAA